MGTGRSGTAIYLKNRTKPISQSDTNSPPGWMSGLQLYDGAWTSQHSPGIHTVSNPAVTQASYSTVP